MKKWTLAAAVIGALVFAPAALAASSPTVAPSATTSIGETSAELHGTVNPNDVATTYQFEYGLTSALGSVSPSPAASAGAGTAAVSEHTTITNLIPDTTYYFELAATSTAGTSTTPLETFKTTGNPAPVSTTETAANVGRFQATLSGEIDPNNQATSYYFEYGLTATYGFQTYTQTAAAGTTTVPVTVTLPGLAPGRTFHYRLVASHGSTSVSYGADSTFTTLPSPRPRPQFAFSVTPHLSTFAPYRFTVSGSIGQSATAPASLACLGNVRVRFFDRGRQVATRVLAVAPDCTYRTNVTIRHLRAGAKRLVVTFWYGGDTYFAPTTVRRTTVRVVTGH
jgi:hypothetical protein